MFGIIFKICHPLRFVLQWQVFGSHQDMSQWGGARGCLSKQGVTLQTGTACCCVCPLWQRHAWACHSWGHVQEWMGIRLFVADHGSQNNVRGQSLGGSLNNTGGLTPIGATEGDQAGPSDNHHQHPTASHHIINTMASPVIPVTPIIRTGATHRWRYRSYNQGSGNYNYY